jgi:hypothetical protein
MTERKLLAKVRADVMTRDTAECHRDVILASVGVEYSILEARGTVPELDFEQVAAQHFRLSDMLAEMDAAEGVDSRTSFGPRPTPGAVS